MPAFAPATISGLAQLSGIDEASIVQYQALGIVPEPRRSRGWSCDVVYHEEHLNRLSFIRRALEMGFELGAVAELVSLSSLATCGDVYEIASRQVARIRAELARLQSIKSEIGQLATECTRRGSGRDCPILNELREASGRQSTLRAIVADHRSRA